jgi:hypothetical protein
MQQCTTPIQLVERRAAAVQRTFFPLQQRRCIGAPWLFNSLREMLHRCSTPFDLLNRRSAPVRRVR